MKLLGENLLTMVVLLVLGIVAYVVVVGGILCIKESDYTYSQYLSDLTRLHGLLIAAIVGALGRALVPLLDRRVNGNGRKAAE